ncbi:MAG: hypothetical protein JWL70_3183 [Acidimicrobiia bacterium]|nr:hypothetical protein [Acidimicrobiia bacterium]
MKLFEAARRSGAGAVKGEVSGAHEIDALLAPDATWWIVGVGNVPRNLFMKAHELVAEEPPVPTSLRFDLVNLVVEGDRAAIEMEIDTTWDGGEYRNNYHHSIKVSDGLITELRQYQGAAPAKRVFKPLKF